MNLENAVVIITGSGTGVGAATAKLLAVKGCRVVINYSKSASAAQQTAEQCRQLVGYDNVLVCQANVSEDADCQRLVNAAVKNGGDWTD